LGEVVDEEFSAREENAPGLGQTHIPCGAEKELKPDCVFKLADPAREDRLVDIKPISCLSEAHFLSHSNKSRKIPAVRQMELAHPTSHGFDLYKGILMQNQHQLCREHILFLSPWNARLGQEGRGVASASELNGVNRRLP
jgi:hypothetical protein